jgi:hypothetical protein
MQARTHQTFQPVTMGHVRSHGCRDLPVYCQSGHCRHSATFNGDELPDETPVRSLCSRWSVPSAASSAPTCDPTGAPHECEEAWG